MRGLSVVGFELEVVGYTIALAYCLHKGLPFSAYGELAFLLIQGSCYTLLFVLTCPCRRPSENRCCIEARGIITLKSIMIFLEVGDHDCEIYPHNFDEHLWIFGDIICYFGARVIDCLC